MERDYVGVIKKKLDDVYRVAGTSAPGRGDKVERENRQAFIVGMLSVKQVPAYSCAFRLSSMIWMCLPDMWTVLRGTSLPIQR